MANPSNDNGHPIRGQIDRRSGEPHEVQNFRSARAPVSLLRIGNYQIRSQNASHLTARWYYMNKQLNWEILEDRRKKKIEINWSNIAAIRVGHGGDLRILEIELYEPPRFYSMGELSPRVRASWNPISDFTDGQASTHRIHYLEFPHGTLERKMEPLFLLDSRLWVSIAMPFPSLESPFFVGHVTGAPQAPLPPPSIDSQLLQHHQIPPNRSSVPTYSSSSNLSTGPQSANYGYPQPSSSMRRSAIILNLGTGNSEPGSGTIRLRIGHSAHYMTASSSNPNNTRYGRGGYHHQAILNRIEIGGYSGFVSSSNHHLVVDLRRPSSWIYSPTNDRNEPPHSMP